MGLASIITMLTQLAYRSYSHNPSSSTWSCSEASSDIPFHLRTEMLAKPVNHTHTPFIYPKLSDIKVDIQKLSSKQWIRAICFGRHHPRCGRGSTEDNDEDLRQISPTAFWQVHNIQHAIGCMCLCALVGWLPTYSTILEQHWISGYYKYYKYNNVWLGCAWEWLQVFSFKGLSKNTKCTPLTIC